MRCTRFTAQAFNYLNARELPLPIERANGAHDPYLENLDLKRERTLVMQQQWMNVAIE